MAGVQYELVEDAPSADRYIPPCERNNLIVSRYQLIRIDGLAGLVAGVVVLAASGLLADLYLLPRWLIIINGVANLAYGSFSTTLATLERRPMTLIIGLVSANLFWATVCIVAAAIIFGSASFFGFAHAVLEAAFVGGLGLLEWRFRSDLRVKRASATLPSDG